MRTIGLRIVGCVILTCVSVTARTSRTKAAPCPALIVVENLDFTYRPVSGLYRLDAAPVCSPFMENGEKEWRSFESGMRAADGGTNQRASAAE
jgi:hypothetical protein